MARACFMRVCAMSVVVLTAAPASAQAPAVVSGAEVAPGPALKTLRVGRWSFRYAAPAEVDGEAITLSQVVAEHDTGGRVWTLRAARVVVRMRQQGAASSLDALEASGQVRLISPSGQVFMAARAVAQPDGQDVLALARAEILHGEARLSAARATVTLASGAWRAETLGDARVVRTPNAPKRSEQE